MLISLGFGRSHTYPGRTVLLMCSEALGTSLVANMHLFIHGHMESKHCSYLEAEDQCLSLTILSFKLYN